MANVERGRQAEVQTQILATSVAAPLAFDDDVAAREYVDALKANRDIEAAGAYDLNGHLAAGFVRRGAPLPARNTLAASRVVGGALLVTQPVVQDGARLGSVFLRVAADSVARRASRYVGIGLLLLMASVLVAGLGAAFASANDANRRLQEEIRSREQAEEALRQAQKMEAMGQLTGGVAHDFNNLLMAASSGLDLLERTADPARQEKLKAGIRQAIDPGAGLTHQLLAFARRTPVHPEVIDPGERLRAMRGLIEHSLREDIVT
ncbi:MAG: hybrid sensor histidine kinase/response regulator, partial [Caulobacteraceae bacterium]|nr:hybrid sensor histidine kinase/response regulator [Caulobacteraceae bacterium]